MIQLPYDPFISDDYAPPESSDLHQMLARGIGDTTGDLFFYSLVKHVALALKVRTVFVTECLGEPATVARMLANWEDGDFAPNIDYPLAPYPCRFVAQGKTCFFPHSVHQYFPDNEDDASYLGIPLFDRQRRVIGHLVVIDRMPMPEEPVWVSTLRVFSQRAAVELEQRQLADERTLSFVDLQRKMAARTAEVDRRRRVATRLHDMLAALNAGATLATMLEMIVTEATDLFAADATAICRLDTDISRIILAKGFEGDDWKRTIPGQDLIAQALLKRRALTGTPRSSDDNLGAPRFAIALAIPLLINYQTDHCLVFYYHRPLELTAETVELAVTYGDQAALVLKNLQLRERSKQMAAIEERTRLARELHDAVSQTLWAANLLADILPTVWAEDPAKGVLRLEQLRQLNRAALTDLRSILLDLHPQTLAEINFADLLRQWGDELQQRSGLNCIVTVVGEYDLPAAVQVVLFRIAQEATHNIVRHAAASHATMSLIQHQHEVVLTITDDGHGFDLSSQLSDSLGLRIMRERAAEIGAELAITSRADQGTTVRVTWRTAQHAPGERTTGASHLG